MDRPEGAPQPTTTSLPPSVPSVTSCCGMPWAMPSTLALRASVMVWWLAGE
jgi:hypothetical protein